jgi:signal transduction histidine kinase
MSLSIDLYGTRSLETRFIYYQTVLVLIMMVFCATIISSETSRAFGIDAALSARRAVRGAMRSHDDRARALPWRIDDPLVVSLARRRGDRTGFEHVAGRDLAGYIIPEKLRPSPVDIDPKDANSKRCWGYLVTEEGRDWLVLIDAARLMRDLNSNALSFSWITGLMLLIHFFIARIMARNVLRPIREFVNAFHKVTQGKVGFQLPVAERDELGQMKATFNLMLQQLKEKELMERQLMHSQHLATVGRLAASVAHEIRNPLASINSLTQLIAGDQNSSPRAHEYAGVILREVTRMDTSIQHLLNFARPTPARFAADRLSRILECVAALMRHEARTRKSELAFDNRWQSELPLLVNASRLQQLFINLVKNSFEALEEGGKVTLALDYDSDSDRAIVTVADDGPGIPADQVPHLFEPFFSTKAGGSGLGLAVVSRIVLQHGGEIRVDTELKNGTRFTLLFPRLARETAERLEGLV